MDQFCELNKLWSERVIDASGGYCNCCHKRNDALLAVPVETAMLKDGTPNYLFNFCPASGVAVCVKCSGETIVFDNLTKTMINLLHDAGETDKFRSDPYTILLGILNAKP